MAYYWSCKTIRRTDLDRGILHEHVGARLSGRVNAPAVHGREGGHARRRARGVDDNRALVAALRHSRDLIV